MSVRSLVLDGTAVQTPSAQPRPPYAVGLMAIIATVTMLFVAFTAALLVRRAAADWVRIDLPEILWWNTGVVLASSLPAELGRRALGRGARASAARWVAGTLGLGLAFLAGQGAAWWALARRGVFLPTSPYASFFYLLSAVHGAHLLGGLIALGWCWRRMRMGASSASQRGLGHATVYWHFVAGVWLYVFVLLRTL